MEGMLDIIIIGMRIKGHGQLRIAVSHDILQRLRVKSGLLHIGAEGVTQHMGRDGRERVAI